LGVSLSRPRGLAPFRRAKSDIGKTEIFTLVSASILVLFMDFLIGKTLLCCLVLAWLIPLTNPKKIHLYLSLPLIISGWTISGFDNPILAIGIIVVSLHFEHLTNKGSGKVLPLLGFLLFMLMQPEQVLLLLPVLILEIIVSIAQANFQRLFIHLAFLPILLTHIILIYPQTNGDSFAGWLLIPFSILLVVFVFPNSSESNLVRVSTPIAILLGVFFLSVEPAGAAILLAGWSVRLRKVGEVKKKQVEVELPAVLVEIRRRNSPS
jgi:hypothetical protein